MDRASSFIDEGQLLPARLSSLSQAAFSDRRRLPSIFILADMPILHGHFCFLMDVHRPDSSSVWLSPLPFTFTVSWSQQVSGKPVSMIVKKTTQHYFFEGQACFRLVRCSPDMFFLHRFVS